MFERGTLWLWRLVGAVALCLGVVGAAQASIATSTYKYYSSLPDGSNGPQADTPPASCDAALPVAQSRYGAGVTVQYQTTGGTYGTCLFFQNGVAWTTRIVLRATVAAYCPANSTMDSGGTSCTCNSGYVESNGACVINPQTAVCQAKASTSAGGLAFLGRGSSVCVAGCTASIGNISVSWQDPSDGSWHSSGQGTYDGTTCTDSSTSPDASVDPCPNGSAGTVNGMTVCVPRDAQNTQSQTVTSGGTSSDGSTTSTTSQTSCVATTCTTTNTTTTTPAGGGSSTTSTTTTTQPFSVYCVNEGKGTALCNGTQNGTSGGGGGSGAGGGSGSGGGPSPGTQASICKDNPSSAGCGGAAVAVDGSKLYTKKARTMGDVFGDAKARLLASPVGSSIGGFFSVSAGGTCPIASGSVDLMGKPVSVTFDFLCTDLAGQLFLLLRAVLLVVATWLAFRIAVE